MIRKAQKGDDENVVTIKIKNKTENEKKKQTKVGTKMMEIILIIIKRKQ